MITTTDGFKKVENNDGSNILLPPSLNNNSCIINDNVDKTIEKLNQKQDTITFSNTGTGNTVSDVTFSNNTLTVTKTTINGAEYTIAKQTTAETNYASTYYLIKDGTQVGEKINIPKDMVVESGSVKECAAVDTPVTGYAIGDKYIDLVIANTNSQHIYILVSDLVNNDADNITFTPPTYMTSTNVQNAIVEVFQSSSNAQNEYETAITGKGGIVSKIGTVATKTEIINGINSIPQNESGYYTDTEISSIENVITGKGGTVSKESDVATAQELINGINTISTGQTHSLYGLISNYNNIIDIELTYSENNTTFDTVSNIPNINKNMFFLGKDFTASGFTGVENTGIDSINHCIVFNGTTQYLVDNTAEYLFTKGFTIFIVYKTTMNRDNYGSWYQIPTLYGCATDGYDKGDFAIGVLNGYLAFWSDDESSVGFTSQTQNVADGNIHVVCLNYTESDGYKLYTENGLQYSKTVTHGSNTYNYRLFNQGGDSFADHGALSGSLYSFASSFSSFTQSKITTIINNLYSHYTS